jgi:hypothetical protein
VREMNTTQKKVARSLHSIPKKGWKTKETENVNIKFIKFIVLEILKTWKKAY